MIPFDNIGYEITTIRKLADIIFVNGFMIPVIKTEVYSDWEVKGIEKQDA
ncbi:MAG: hypothetical protein PHX80_03960 [Candidatus Nanoarchaeia archaeon]|nr:hypothetical protein [Candidatus Nanoarchaeia archaeon]